MIPDESPQRMTLRRSLIPSKKKNGSARETGRQRRYQPGDEH